MCWWASNFVFVLTTNSQTRFNPTKQKTSPSVILSCLNLWSFILCCVQCEAYFGSNYRNCNWSKSFHKRVGVSTSQRCPSPLQLLRSDVLTMSLEYVFCCCQGFFFFLHGRLRSLINFPGCVLHDLWFPNSYFWISRSLEHLYTLDELIASDSPTLVPQPFIKGFVLLEWSC